MFLKILLSVGYPLEFGLCARGNHNMAFEQYEFTGSQNELIRDLAKKMRFVSYFLIGVGVLSAIAGLLTVLRGGGGSIINGIVYIVIGIWTTSAASSFQKIVDTQGNDIENLMLSLGELRKLYTFQYWLLIIALVFLALVFVLALLGGLTGAGS